MEGREERKNGGKMDNNTKKEWKKEDLCDKMKDEERKENGGMPGGEGRNGGRWEGNKI